ncbi:MAG TPA: hypothetical protein DEA52_06030 [Clostridiaceae bacterium]|nr:hypothetical protein [Clostridiaceae bacterium]
MMNDRKKWMVLGVVLLAFLGTLFGLLRMRTPDKPPVLKVFLSEQVAKEGVLGTYTWTSLGQMVEADSDHPSTFIYEEAQRIEASQGQKIYLAPKASKDPLVFQALAVEVYEKGSQELINKVDFVRQEEAVVVSVEEEEGTYVYVVHMAFEGKGDAYYGLEVQVDVQDYPVEELLTLKTPYVGDHGQVGKILSLLPPPGAGYQQRFLSLDTQREPFGLTGYYEAKEEFKNHLIFPDEEGTNQVYKNMERNALAIFSLVDNAGWVTFQVRQSPSQGTLEEKAYEGKVTFYRKDFEEHHGELDQVLLDETLFPRKED